MTENMTIMIVYHLPTCLYFKAHFFEEHMYPKNPKWKKGFLECYSFLETKLVIELLHRGIFTTDQIYCKIRHAKVMHV